MPIYEYRCLECGERFDALRPMAQADAPIACPGCETVRTARAVSVFSAHSGGKVVAGSPGGSCAGCTGGSCSSCGN